MTRTTLSNLSKDAVLPEPLKTDTRGHMTSDISYPVTSSSCIPGSSLVTGIEDIRLPPVNLHTKPSQQGSHRRQKFNLWRASLRQTRL